MLGKIGKQGGKRIYGGEEENRGKDEEEEGDDDNTNIGKDMEKHRGR